MKMTGNIWYDIYWRDNNYLSQYARIKVSAYSSSKVFFSDLSGDYSTTARRITPTTTGYVTIAVTQYNSLSSGYFYIRVY